MRRPKKSPHVTPAVQPPSDVGLSDQEKAIIAQAKKAVRTVHTAADTKRQMALVLDAWVTGLGERQTQNALRNQKPPVRISIGRIRTLRKRIQDEAKEEFDRERETLKLSQLARITRYRRQAEQKTKEENGETIIVREADHTALVKYEHLYADIAGTREPLKIDVDVVHREALTDVIGNMNEELAQKYIEAYDNLAHLAAAGAAHLGAELPAVLPKPQLAASNGVTKKAS